MSSPALEAPVLEAKNLSKFFGQVISLNDVSLTASAGKVTCVLGDNGAGKSTLIKILAGFHQPDKGSLLVDGHEQAFRSPHDARKAGVAVVYQDLAMQPLMPVWRNFFLGEEPRRRIGPFRFLDRAKARRVCREELAKMGINVRSVDQPVGSLSGGERQSIATARAVYFGARLLILDEPTSALGVRQSGVVLKYVLRARNEGLAVIFITHNPAHATMVGDHFVLLNRGKCIGDYAAGTVSEEELIHQMSGGSELAKLKTEMAAAASAPTPTTP